jgi:hypothetical protein
MLCSKITVTTSPKEESIIPKEESIMKKETKEEEKEEKETKKAKKFDVDAFFDTIENNSVCEPITVSRMWNYKDNRRIGYEIPRYIEDDIISENIKFMELILPLIKYEIEKSDRPLYNVEELLKHIIRNSLKVTKYVLENTTDVKIPFSKLSSSEIKHYSNSNQMSFLKKQQFPDQGNLKKQQFPDQGNLKKQQFPDQGNLTVKDILNAVICQYGDKNKHHLVKSKFILEIRCFNDRHSAFGSTIKETGVDMLTYLYSQGLNFNYKGTIHENIKAMIEWRYPSEMFEFVLQKCPLESYTHFTHDVLRCSGQKVLEYFLNTKKIDFNLSTTKEILEASHDLRAFLIRNLENETLVNALIDDLQTEIQLEKNKWPFNFWKEDIIASVIRGRSDFKHNNYQSELDTFIEIGKEQRKKLLEPVVATVITVLDAFLHSDLVFFTTTFI